MPPSTQPPIVAAPMVFDRGGARATRDAVHTQFTSVEVFAKPGASPFGDAIDSHERDELWIVFQIDRVVFTVEFNGPDALMTGQGFEEQISATLLVAVL
jgi:hypothetical protein